jgi:cell division protease FtsH
MDQLFLFFKIFKNDIFSFFDMSLNIGNSNLIQFNSQYNSVPFFPIVIFIFVITLFLFSDQIGQRFEKNWERFMAYSYKYEPNNNNAINNNSFDDPLTEFTRLDENVIEVINETKVKFSDVAGNEEAKKELKEVVKFLKDPKDFAKLGASVPKGVLLGGPPGTGKTLLARAIAGESGTPFLKVSGSQFVELLVGIGAARVRELFEKARELKPAIIFIDEIDSIARNRSLNNGMGGGNDEREQTLNQILTEMDGFKADTGIIVVAATNRIDILDPAIKRPGRFDRQITINNPNYKERIAILKVHARGKKFQPDLTFNPVASRTIGFSGAELENVLNEAAILATRRKKRWITLKEINASIDRLVIGLEGKQLVRVKARQLTAFHEMGHAFIATLVNGGQRIEKLTVIPRGNTQGTTWTIPPSTQYSSRKIFVQQVLISLAGRAAEEIVNGVSECTVGAQQDIAQMTRIVRIMIVRYAMARLQELKQEIQQRNLSFIGSDAKTEINNIVDNFTTNFLDSSYNQVLKALQILRPSGERLVDELMVFEEISGKELRGLVRQYLSNLKRTRILKPSRKYSILTRSPLQYRYTLHNRLQLSVEELLRRYTLLRQEQLDPQENVKIVETQTEIQNEQLNNNKVSE